MKPRQNKVISPNHRRGICFFTQHLASCHGGLTKDGNLLKGKMVRWMWASLGKAVNKYSVRTIDEHVRAISPLALRLIHNTIAQHRLGFAMNNLQNSEPANNLTYTGTAHRGNELCF